MQKAGLLLLAFAMGCSGSEPPSEHPDEVDSGAPQDAGGFMWSEVAPCPVPRFEANGVVVDGELWVMGGFLSSMLDVTKRIDIYNPGSNQWRLGPELPGAETHMGVVSVN